MDRQSTGEEGTERSVRTLVGALADHHPDANAHSRQVVALASAVGARLGLEAGELWLLRCAARLHDIGKLFIPEVILSKPGPLAPRERELMERHSEYGEQIAASTPGLDDVAPAIRSVHERWDGYGYPDRLKREAIPLPSRIILACDAYSAMLTDRPYRSARPDHEARTELNAQSGHQFDPRVAAALLAELRIGSVGLVVAA